METTITEKQDTKNRRIIASSLIPDSKRRYLLQEATVHVRHLAAEQIRYQMAPILIVGGLVLAAMMVTKQGWGSWSQSMSSLAALLMVLLAGYEIKRFRDLRATAAERASVLEAIPVINDRS